MLSYLEVKDGFIQLAKEKFDTKFTNWVRLPNQVKLRMLDTGVLEVKPAESSDHAMIISCGIHGNETAPIEIVSNQISQLVTGALEPKCNLLYILGNPESMKIADRFVEINMNRLFAGAYNSYDKTNENSYELERAARIEYLVSGFYEEYQQASKTHLDLHTAIKPSYHKTFAIRPFNPSPITNRIKETAVIHGD